jgi:putative ABC transport system permease protein
MIGLVGSMLRARVGSALTVFLLGAGATAAAVSASVYVAAADQAVVASEVTRASATELSIHTRRVADPGGTRSFELTASSTLDMPGFVTYFAVEADVYVEGSIRSSVPPLVHRDEVCAHIRIVSGRCFAAPGEVVVGDKTAKIIGATVGQALPAKMVVGHPTEGYMTVGDPVLLTVVGLYTPLDQNDEYWGFQQYFVPNGYDRLTEEPVLTNRLTVENTPRNEERQSVDAVAGPGAITATSVPAVRTRVNEALASLKLLEANSTTDIPALLDRIDRSRVMVAEIVPIAAVPLVLLCWFVLFLAVAAAAQRRRHELGLLALRGVRTPYR